MVYFTERRRGARAKKHEPVTRLLVGLEPDRLWQCLIVVVVRNIIVCASSFFFYFWIFSLFSPLENFWRICVFSFIGKFFFPSRLKFISLFLSLSIFLLLRGLYSAKKRGARPVYREWWSREKQNWDSENYSVSTIFFLSSIDLTKSPLRYVYPVI